MIQLFSRRKKRTLSWTIRRRAYPLLVLQLAILYIRSSKFRALVRVSVRHRRAISINMLCKLAKGYLLVTNSRLTINGFAAFSLPKNGRGLLAKFGRWYNHHDTK